MRKLKGVALAALLAALLAPTINSAEAVDTVYASKKAKIVNTNYNNIVLNEQEQKLDKKLQEMKQAFAKAYPIKVYDANVIFDPKVWNDDLYKFFMKLPKGADLHLHGGAMMNPLEYIDLYASYDNVYVYTQYVDEKGPRKQPALLRCFKSKDAVETGYVNLKEGLANGRVDKNWIFDLLSCKTTPSDIRMWDYFEDISKKRIQGQTPEMRLNYYITAFESYCKRNVNHLEIQEVFWDNLDDSRKTILVMREAYYAVKKKYPDFTMRVIPSCVKLPNAFTVEKTQKAFDNAIVLSNEILDEFDPQNPKPFIIGLNLLAEEDLSRDLDQYAEVMHNTLKKKPSLKVELHAGESLLMDNDDVVDAYLLKANRLGHAINLYRYPKAVDNMKKSNVSISLCPVSNNILGYVYDLRMHPGVEYMRRGISVHLASDDPLKEEHEGLVDDFFMATIAWDLNLADIKMLAKNSLKNSFLTKKEKQAAISAWENKWNSFVEESLKK